MKLATAFCLSALMLTPALSFADDQPVPTSLPFKSTVLASDLDFPWAMTWGPDDHIWLTERMGKRITRVDPENGDKKVALTIEDAFVGPQHEGLLGLALSPDFETSGSDNHVFVAYTYKNNDQEFIRIARYTYNAEDETLAEPQAVLEGIPAGNDHNGGRLIFGPDGKLYFSHGELGHNQNANFCKPIEAQRLPTSQELESNNYDAYVGKILRFNVDGSIPDDNPTIDGVKSHVFTYGHRNPQGLVFVGDHLFSSEQGPSSDDEINLLEAGGNYGWPHVAGYQDDQSYVYANYSAAENCSSLKYDANYIPEGVPVQKESEWHADNFKEPVKTLFTIPNGYNFRDERCGDMSYICWPTVAPASVAYYPEDGPIEAWRNSLLVATLKSGALYRLPLNADQTTVQGDVIKYFTSENRYRDVLVSPDGKHIYIATDKEGHGRGLNGEAIDKMANPGQILVFSYDQ